MNHHITQSNVCRYHVSKCMRYTLNCYWLFFHSDISSMNTEQKETAHFVCSIGLHSSFAGKYSVSTAFNMKHKPTVALLSHMKSIYIPIYMNSCVSLSRDRHKISSLDEEPVFVYIIYIWLINSLFRVYSQIWIHLNWDNFVWHMYWLESHGEMYRIYWYQSVPINPSSSIDLWKGRKNAAVPEMCVSLKFIVIIDCPHILL